jgi:hypothetical protein
MTCQQCRKWILEERAVVGPSQEPFCSGECRNQWIWYSQTQPTGEVSEAMLRASRVAQTEYLRRLKDRQPVYVQTVPKEK